MAQSQVLIGCEMEGEGSGAGIEAGFLEVGEDGGASAWGLRVSRSWIVPGERRILQETCARGIGHEKGGAASLSRLAGRTVKRGGGKWPGVDR